MPLTDTGFSRPIQPELAESIATDQRSNISSQLDLSESTVLGNVNNIVADRLALAYEILEEAYNGMDPDNATGDRLVALALLTGTERRGPQEGSVTITATLEGSLVFSPGELVVHAEDDPENRWVNRDEVVTVGPTDDYDLTFLSDGTGPDFVATAGTLTVIAEPIAGFLAATNAEDATPGTDTESIEDLRQRRENEIARGGSGTVDAIRADVEALDGMIQVLVEENTTDSPVGALTPRSDAFSSVTAPVPDNAVSKADGLRALPFNVICADTRPAGIPSVGTLSGTAARADGGLVTVAFERAEVVDIYISANIVSAVGVSEADVIAALQAAMPTAIGGDVVYNRLSAAVFIEGVDDFVSFTIGTAPSPVGTSSIAISTIQIAQLDAGNVVLSGDVS